MFGLCSISVFAVLLHLLKRESEVEALGTGDDGMTGPRNIPCGIDRGVEMARHEDGAMQTIPRSPQRALAQVGLRNAGVFGGQGALRDVGAVLVGEGGGGVGAFPGGDAPAAAAQLERRVGDVQRAEAVEEVGLSGDDAVRHVAVAELADVDGVLVAGEVGVVEGGVGAGGGEGEGRPGGVGQEGVGDVQVVAT